MKSVLFVILTVLFLSSCSKEREAIPVTPPRIPEQWEKFIGFYKVYDTLGNYKYDMEIYHFKGVSAISSNMIDSILIQNFADTFDLKFQFSFHTPETVNFLDIGFHDSIVDRNNKTCGLWSLSDDLSTSVKENYLVNDTIIIYFKQTNIKYYINEAQPYYYCECKHVAVKQ
ncbi:MAG: hypothetical protein KF732_01215 [Flavobacteriales bacterium]|nr:hypothetical protein [Flavobacteriales bacterium]MBX2958550.1 hypothetical protein [Flavobacteriales bacterium]MCL4856809.1 hypothetical protein [Flavobacteriales bacterium]